MAHTLPRAGVRQLYRNLSAARKAHARRFSAISNDRMRGTAMTLLLSWVSGSARNTLFVAVSYKSPQFSAFTASFDSTLIPYNIHSALECSEWKTAAVEEMRALEKNKNWEICTFPKRQNREIGCWKVLIDAAKGCATDPPDLSKYNADFVVISFYKLFGYPTGLGALIVHTERSNNEILEKSLGNTHTKTKAAAVVVATAVVDTTMEKLLQRIQTPSIYPMGQPSPPCAQPFDQKPLHAPPLSGAWAHAPPSVSLTSHSIHFYASSLVQSSHPSGHSPRHAPPIAVGQQPSKLSRLYSNANLYVDPLEQPFFYRNGVDQRHNRSRIEAGESSAPSDCGQPYVCGLGIDQTYRRAVFEVGASLTQTDLPIIMGNQFSFVSTARNDIPRISVVNSTVRPQEPTGPTASQTSSPTLSVIAQSGATDHLIGFSEHFFFYTPVPDLSSGRTIGTARHSRGLYILDDATFDAILTAAHLINRTPSRILHLQPCLECLKESYPSTRLVSEVPLRVFGCTAYVHNFGPNQTKFTPRAQACVFVGYLLHHRDYKCFHPLFWKYFVTMDVTFCEDRPYFPVSHFQGESVSKESNNTFEFIESTPSTVSDIDPHPIILPTNQVSWKTCYKRNIRKEVGSDVVVLENVEEKNSGEETEVRTETSNNEAEQGHTGKLDKQKSVNLSRELKFEIKGLGNLKYFLRMEVVRSKEGISMSLRKYILDLLIETSMLGCRPADTPIEFNCKLGNSNDQVPVDKEQY
ncbi:reverse transcriptase [Cucumis melo var. makuwa]|uniref:Reverse transcriptase n=1 Tax=Cucumis melo var. makuwa TaxID=1194695 RepID=A0A5D3C9I6_CUCMM|nr:reverse transcriptase [Cucumis melo var. makuwa]